tara:strand:+ start:94 stop:285 length:192 start_codon:yes stop_codon:yes gene_type:complete
MMIFVKALFFLILGFVPALAFAHEGHLTAGTIFHLAEHVGVVMLVLVVISLLVIKYKAKKRMR